MLDIRILRDKPDWVKAELAKVGLAAETIDDVIQCDRQRRDLIKQVEDLRAHRAEVSRTVGRQEASAREKIVADMRAVGDQISALEAQLNEAEANFRTKMLNLPNFPDPTVPLGADDSENRVVRSHGEPRTFDFEPVPHWDLGPRLGILDFDRGTKISGSRFYLLRGLGAKLQRALIHWMLDVHTREHGYLEIQPPYMVKTECLYGAGQLPKFADNVYRDAEEDYSWIGTAEIPLTNIHRDEILDAAMLPLSYVSHTPCFRREKMSAGRDVRGIKRGHQFDKVEMFKLVEPDQSAQALELIVSNAEDIARRLKIPYRVIDICTGDLGFVAAKKYDVEMWAPGCKEWLEVSSCSNCTDFQARRANLRYRKDAKSKPEYLHTLNGSGLALPRVMISVIENYQQADGSVVVPDVLRPYVGWDRITPA